MALKLRPINDRLEMRIHDLKESAKEARLKAAYCVGGMALNGFGLALNESIDNKVGMFLNGAVVVATAAVAAYEGLKSNASSQEAAALEGALAQHELAVDSFKPDQSSHFTAQPQVQGQ